MSACPSLAYTGVTLEAWTAIVAAVKADYHVDIGQEVGTASGDGFELSWHYDRAKSTLTIQCIDSPWWAGCSMINGTIDKMVKPLLKLDRHVGVAQHP